MELSVFRVRVAPLLPPDSLRALRCVSCAWQDIVDQLVPVKGALGLRPGEKWTPADARFAHAYVKTVTGPVELSTALAACAGGDVQDLQWGLAAFLPRNTSPMLSALERMSQRVVRQECLVLLMNEHGLSPRAAFVWSCQSGRLELAQWLVATFGLTAEDARRSLVLHRSCANGHLAVAQWLVATFNLTAAENVRSSLALHFSCENGHLAVAQWLVATFGADDTRRSFDYLSTLLSSCSNGHLVAVVQWLVSTFGPLTPEVVRSLHLALVQRGRLGEAQWLVSTYGGDDE
jgi:hypothetical protein